MKQLKLEVQQHTSKTAIQQFLLILTDTVEDIKANLEKLLNAS
jgi:hypothetical protein